MDSIVGLTLEEAKKAATVAGMHLDIVHYSAKSRWVDADTDIVIRQAKKNDCIEIVVSAFQTKPST
ncbi:MAG: hypothetical protein AB1Z19_05640 [Eubacteriales bacterium]